jgi:hypothetical protein
VPAGAVQVHQDIVGIPVLRVGLQVYVTALTVAHAHIDRLGKRCAAGFAGSDAGEFTIFKESGSGAICP